MNCGGVLFASTSFKICERTRDDRMPGIWEFSLGMIGNLIAALGTAKGSRRALSDPNIPKKRPAWRPTKCTENCQAADLRWYFQWLAHVTRSNRSSSPAPDHSPNHKSCYSRLSIMRVVYFCMGCVMVALGAIGAVTPLLPTTIFLIIAAWCFARSSPRLEAWLLNHPTFGKTLRD